MVNRLLKKQEFYVALAILILSAIIGYRDPSFLTVGNLFDLLRASIVLGLMSLAAFIVILSGGIDVSFASMAACSFYIPVVIFKTLEWQGPLWLIFLIGAGVGVLLGLFNAFFVVRFELSTLIVTLGTLSLFRGGLLAFVGTKLYNRVPSTMVDLAKTNLITAKQGRLIYGLPMAFLFLAVGALLTWLIIKYTQTGRGIAAVGGNPEAAKRVGFNVNWIRTFVFIYAGLLSGVAGVIHSSLNRLASPFDLAGSEFDVIAAVVLGGANISGGQGSVPGVMLGVFLIVMINNSLILLGISSYWQQAVIGLLILLSVGATKYQADTDEIEMSQV